MNSKVHDEEVSSSRVMATCDILWGSQDQGVSDQSPITSDVAAGSYDPDRDGSSRSDRLLAYPMSCSIPIATGDPGLPSYAMYGVRSTYVTMYLCTTLLETRCSQMFQMPNTNLQSIKVGSSPHRVLVTPCASLVHS